MYRTTGHTQNIRLKSARGRNAINLALTGFKHQTVISLDELKALVMSIPSQHIAGLAEISYQPVEKALYPALSRAKLCTGEYILELRKIVVYEASDNAVLKHVIAHEVGHYVFHHILDQSRRYSWTRQISPRARFVTRYAQTNASEDFAECYAFYLLNRSELESIPTKHNFFKIHVFGK